ncbi:flagellar motor protein MotB [Microbacteriaceae bacterium 4G12]
MARKKKKHDNHIDETWLIPYADMLTLLLALFIVLFAMSSINAEKFKEMAVAFNSELKGGTGNKQFLSENKSPSDKNLSATKKSDEELKKEEQERLKQLEMNELREVQKKIDTYIQDNNLSLSLKTTLTEKGLMITILDTVLFDSGQAVVKIESMPVAKQMADLLVTAAPREIMISGHTDNVPISNSQFASNWDLSTQRAVNFLQVLLENPKLSPDKFSAIGYGEFRPVESNDTAEGKTKNRRVEVLILPLKKE